MAPRVSSALCQSTFIFVGGGLMQMCYLRVGGLNSKQ